MIDQQRLSLAYGTHELSVTLPSKNLSEILTPTLPKNIPHPIQEIERALQNPIGCKHLGELATADCKVVLICDDNTRLTPTHIIVPKILEELNKAGIQDKQIKIIMALGTHRSMSLQEFEAKLGKEVMQRIEVMNHEFRNPAVLYDFGVTKNGTPVKVNKLVLEADIVIGVGSIVPHHIPGYSGGAKIVQPGICGENTTAETHLLSVRTRRNMLGIAESKVRDEMEEIAEKAGVHYVFNTVLDLHGRVIEAFFGDIKQAFRAGVSTSRNVYGVKAKSKTPIVIGSSYPCDLEFWQAHKTLYPCDMLVEDGGMIIVVTPCPEGIAVTHPEMLKFANQSPQDIDAQIRDGRIRDKVAGALALAWSKIRDRAEICLVSGGIDRELAEKVGFTYAANIEEALQKGFARLGDKAKVSVLSHGADLLPLIPGDELSL